jgi:DNA-binding transcriptional LysR family regulator
MATSRYAEGVTLDQLELFAQIVDAGSFSRAATKLRRAQSAVSYGLQRLERQLGVKLLDRSLAGARPTAPGRLLLAEAREVIAHVDRLRAAGLAFSEHVEPELSVSVSPVFPIDFFAAIAREMRDRFPHTVLRVHGGNLGATLADVEQGRTTLGLTGLEVPPSMVAHLAMPVEMIRVVGRDHPLAKVRTPVGAKELRKHLQLVAMDTSEMADRIALNILSPRTWRIADTMVRYEMTVAGVGWTHFVRAWVAADIDAGRLVALRFGKNETPPRYTPRIFYRAAAPPGPAGRWLIERMCGDPSASQMAASKPSRARRTG